MVGMSLVPEAETSDEDGLWGESNSSDNLLVWRNLGVFRSFSKVTASASMISRELKMMTDEKSEDPD